MEWLWQRWTFAPKSILLVVRYDVTEYAEVASLCPSEPSYGVQGAVVFDECQ